MLSRPKLGRWVYQRLQWRGGARVGVINGEFVLNPMLDEMASAALNVVDDDAAPAVPSNDDFVKARAIAGVGASLACTPAS